MIEPAPHPRHPLRVHNILRLLPAGGTDADDASTAALENSDPNPVVEGGALEEAAQESRRGRTRADDDDVECEFVVICVHRGRDGYDILWPTPPAWFSNFTPKGNYYGEGLPKQSGCLRFSKGYLVSYDLFYYFLLSMMLFSLPSDKLIADPSFIPLPKNHSMYVL